MSQYWGATCGCGLILSWDEFRQFLERYVKERPYTDWLIDFAEGEGIIPADLSESTPKIDIDKVEFKALYDCIDFGETEFIWSNEADDPISDEEGRRFCIDRAAPDQCEGMYFAPINGEAGYCDWSRATYVVWGNKSDSVLARVHYNSADELVQECKSKLSKYLPEDFVWEAHIGVFSYAQFC